LQVIRSGIDIAIVIGLDAIGIAVELQIDAEAGVREDRVAKNGVVNRAGVMHKDSCDTGVTHRSAAAIEGYDVARVSVRAADGVVVTIDQDAARIAQGLCASNIGANNVALDEVAGGVLSDDYTKVASAGVGGDQIAGWRTRSSCQTADHGI